LGYNLNYAESNLYCKEQLNDTFCYTGWCSENYEGNLCQTCKSGYAKSNNIYCVPCSNNPSYYVLIVVFLLLAIGFIVFTVKNALKIKPTEAGYKPKSSILMKIFFNYLQLVSIVSSFPFDWPSAVTSMFSSENTIASSSSQVFSIDCFFPAAKQGDSFRPYFVKLLFISLSPLLLIVVSTAVWFFVFLYYKMKNGTPIDKHKFKSNLTTTVVVLLFMIHTNLVQTVISSFK
jgi:hypothetical protein